MVLSLRMFSGVSLWVVVEGRRRKWLVADDDSKTIPVSVWTSLPRRARKHQTFVITDLDFNPSLSCDESRIGGRRRGRA